MDFRQFAKILADNFSNLSKGELYRVDISGDDLWELYLASFPEGTNPIFRVRTEHDGSYDRSFVRRLGNVVSMDKDGNLTSIWSLFGRGLNDTYATVCHALAQKVEAANIISLFRIDEKKLGYVSTTELMDSGVHTWYHFNAEIQNRHFSTSVAEAVGETSTTASMFKRALEELTPEAISTALDLIDSNSVYRGQEHRKSVAEFQKAQASYLPLGERDRNLFIWKFITSPVARIRNSVIGTLLIDLSEGKDVEFAVTSFGKKVAGDSYKRPKAIITQGMVDQAMKKISELDLEASLDRRFAKLSDVSVNNVIWVNNKAQAQMKGGLAGLLSAEVKQPTPTTSEEISIDDFMKLIPSFTSMEVLLENSIQKNLMSITAPVHENVVPIFKWNNNFAWSYKGNIADSLMRQAVQARGGSVTGVFRFTHQWNYGKRNASLMDLHVFLPNHDGHREGIHDEYGNSNRVGWNNRTHQASRGRQDVDYVNEAPAGYVPVENITFPDLEHMRDGDYVCKVHNWQLRMPTDGGFRAEIEFGGQIFQYEVDRPLKHKEWVTVATVTKRGSNFSISHALPCSATSQEVWGLKTEAFVPVSTLMFSPSFWDDQEIGLKHWFFILEGCLNDEPARGIYNEFLRSDLTSHGKVFEVLGAKTKCPVVPEQLSGVGFSLNKNESVTVKVTSPKSTRVYKVNF